MNTEDKLLLGRFITRMRMFILATDSNTIISFIDGYEIGTKGKCKFSELLGEFILKKYKIKPSNPGWAGQVTMLATKHYYNDWTRAFKNVALEFLLAEEPDESTNQLKKTIRTIYESLISQIIEGRIDPRWVEKWIELYNPKNSNFKNLWTAKEWKVLKAIEGEIVKMNVFKNRSPLYLPSEEMLQHRLKFDELQNKQNE